MRKIKCKACGLIFQATGEICFCENCRKERMNTNYMERTCKNCGAAFMGYPRSFFCEECGEQRKRDKKREYNRRQKEGKTLKIGSMKPCESCGEEFSVNSARQRYCSKCRNLAVKKNISVHKEEYTKTHLEEQKQRKKDNKSFRKICVVCGKNFDDVKRNGTTTCSEECRKEAIAISGAKTAQRYKGRKTEYGVRKYSDTPKSGIPGITYCRGKWQVTYKRVYVGIFPTIYEAQKALNEYKKNQDAEKEGENK